jgi:hypothetical protein
VIQVKTNHTKTIWSVSVQFMDLIWLLRIIKAWQLLQIYICSCVAGIKLNCRALKICDRSF